MTRCHALRALAVAAVLLSSGSATASVADDLAAAKTAGRPVFLVVTDASVASLDLARRVAGEAAQIAGGVAVVEVDRGARENAAVVTTYRLASVPVPLVLVVAGNGVAVGGARPHQITAARLARMVPTPAKAAHMKALSEGRADFVVFSRESSLGRAEALAACRAAAATLGGRADLVLVDLDDPAEAAFRDELQVDAKTKVVVVKVYNAKGKPTDTFREHLTAEALVASVGKEGDCGCGPEGCK